MPRLPRRRPGVGSRGEPTPPLDWLVGQQALMEAEANLKVAVELSIHTAVKALPEGPMGDDEDAFECSLCLEDAAAGDRVRTLGCSHRFHTKCIDHWLCEEQCFKERRCPLCNADPLEPIGAALTKAASGADGGAGAASSSSAPAPRGNGSSGGSPATHGQQRINSQARVGATATEDGGGIFWGGVPISELLPRRLFVDTGSSDEPPHPMARRPAPALPSPDSRTVPDEASSSSRGPPSSRRLHSEHGSSSGRGGSRSSRGGGGALGLLLC